MNKRALALANVTEQDYLKYCEDNHKPVHSKSTRTEFFAKIIEGRLVKNYDGKLIKARRK